MLLHALDVRDAHGQVAGVANGLDRELADEVELHPVDIIHHLRYRHLLLLRRYKEVNLAEVVAVHDVDVDDVLLEGQDEGGVAFGLEVYFDDLVGLVVNVLVHRDEDVV